MSDDFDKDDLWDDEDDHKDGRKPGDDEEIFDWQQGGKPGDKSRREEDSLGFTGELSWLQDDEDGSAPGQNEDRTGLTGDLPWLQGSDESRTPGQQGSDRLGMTGELPWMQSDGAEQSGQEDDLSWLGEDDDDTPPSQINTGNLFLPPDEEEEDAPPERSWTGEHVTADLDVPDWMRDSGPDWIDDERDDDDWETAAASAESEEDDSDAFDEDVPDWLSGDPLADIPQPPEEEDEPEIPAASQQGPEWLQQFDTSHFGEKPPVDNDDPLNDVPDWLAGMDDEFATEEDTSFTQDGQLSADWLAQGSELPQTSESDLTFDEWMVNQEELEREPELDELVPDTFADLGDFEEEPAVTAEEIDTGMLPDWFLGMEELDTSDAPDWFTEEVEETPTKEPTEPNKPTGPLPDIFGFDDETTDEEAITEGSTLEDFFTNVEVDDLNELVQVEDEDYPPQPAETHPETELDDDFFASLGAVQTEASLDEPNFDDFDFPEAEAESEDDYAGDFFSSLGAATPADDLPEPSLADFGEEFMANLGMEEDAEPLEDDFPAQELTPLGDDFFASLGIEDDDEPVAETPSAESELDLDALFAAQPDEIDASQIADGDFLSSLGIEDSDESADDNVDWFAEAEDEIADDGEAMGWLDDLGDLDDEDAAEPVDADFMAALGASAPSQPSAESEYGDIDSILASIDRVDATLPDSSPLNDSNFDFDTLMTDPAFSDMQSEGDSSTEEELSQQEWLTELGASVGAVSAAAIVRQQQDRPVDQLSDRLQRLRAKAEDEPAASQETSSALMSDLLPGISGTLAASNIERDASSIASSVIITPEQQKRIDLLKTLAASEDDLGEPALSAIERTYDSPYMLDDDDDLPGLLDEDEQVATAKAIPVAVPREKRRIRLDRLLIAIVLAAVIIAPFFLREARIGQPPPASFAAGSPGEAFYQTISRLRPGQFVLVGMEYGPTAAGELDTTASVVLRHILMQGAHPVVVSGNPVALLRASNLLADIGTDAAFLTAAERSTPLTANNDYYVIRYLSGSSVGLRGFSQNPLPLLATDLQGAPTGLNRLNEMSDFSAVIVIAERAEDMRNWAEQVAPLSRVAFLGASGLAAAPLNAPYLGAALDGLLVGYQDALTYDALLTSGAVIVPATAAPGETLEPDNQAGAGDDDNLTPTVEITSSPDLPSPTPTPIALGVINASSSINVRSGPGSAFAVVTSVDPGDEVVVLSLDNTSGWVNVRLPDGTEGWVSSSLIVVLPTGATATVSAATTEAPVASNTPAPTGTAAPSSTPRPTQTNAPTQTQGATNTVTSVAPSSTPTVAITNTTAPTATPVSTTITARVISSESINVRSGPGTGFAPVGTAAPGDEFTVVGRNGAGDWISIEFGDAEEAWIASFLLEISAEEIPPADTSQADNGIVLAAGSDLRLVPYRAQVEPSEEPTIEATSTVVSATSATEEAQATETIVDMSGEIAATQYTIPYAEERWYSMNLGLVAIIIIIVLGALINIGRAVFRRRG